MNQVADGGGGDGSQARDLRVRAYERVTVRCAGMAFECQGTGRGESSIL